MSSLDACPGNGRRILSVTACHPQDELVFAASQFGTFSNSPIRLKQSDSTKPVNVFDDTLGPQEAQITLSYTLLPVGSEDNATALWEPYA